MFIWYKLTHLLELTDFQLTLKLEFKRSTLIWTSFISCCRRPKSILHGVWEVLNNILSSYMFIHASEQCKEVCWNCCCIPWNVQQIIRATQREIDSGVKTVKTALTNCRMIEISKKKYGEEVLKIHFSESRQFFYQYLQGENDRNTTSGLS